MTLEVIKTSVYDLMEASGLSLPLFYSSVDTPTPTTDHFRPFVLPGNTSTLGLHTLNQELGIIQVNVYISKGGSNSGEVTPVTLAQEILDIFPRNLELTGLRIDQAGSISPALNDNGWEVTPVTIPYQNVC